MKTQCDDLLAELDALYKRFNSVRHTSVWGGSFEREYGAAMEIKPIVNKMFDTLIKLMEARSTPPTPMTPDVTQPPGQWVKTADGLPQVMRTIVFDRHGKAEDDSGRREYVVHSWHLGWRQDDVWWDMNAVKPIDGTICHWMYVPQPGKCDLE